MLRSHFLCAVNDFLHKYMYPHTQHTELFYSCPNFMLKRTNRKLTNFFLYHKVYALVEVITLNMIQPCLPCLQMALKYSEEYILQTFQIDLWNFKPNCFSS